MARRKRTGDSDVDGWIEEHLRAVSESLQSAMKDTVGVDTGALQDSITIEEKGEDFYVGVDEDLLVTDPRNPRGRNYAGYHHDGTARTRANPFLDKAINRIQ